MGFALGSMNFGQIAVFPPGMRQEVSGWESIQAIAADGSNRSFFRLRRGETSCICLYHPRPPGSPVTENDSYYLIGRHLRQQGLPVPAILMYSREEGWFLLEDLGDISLQEEYLQQAQGRRRLDLYRQALELLMQLQLAGSQNFNPQWCFDTPYYDAELVRTRECHYFTAAFLHGYLDWPIPPAELEEDFSWLLTHALLPAEHFLVHRDFQSRNLLIHRDRLGLIDFQGARLGPPQYDLAALLLDPYVQLPDSLQDLLLNEFLDLLQRRLPVDPGVWRQRYQYVALCRNLQILGAYGFLSRQQGKPFFAQFIPAACRSLAQRLALLPPGEMPTLRKIARQALIRLVGQGG